MTATKQKLNHLIVLCQVHRFTKAQRRSNGLTYNHINIIINLYVLQAKGENITLTDIAEIVNYISFNKVKYFMKDLIGVYVSCKDNKYYSLLPDGINLINDILDNYDNVLRGFLEKYRLNELF